MTYASVVSRDSVRIGFLLAALNDLNILAGDIQNAFLHAQTKEKLFFFACDEWGASKGRRVLIVRALYGLKSSAYASRAELADVLSNTLRFKSSLADPDVWMKPMTKPGGSTYYAYIFVYVDEILILDIDPRIHMTKLEESYPVKKGSIEEPKTYLGSDIGKIYYPDGSMA